MFHPLPVAIDDAPSALGAVGSVARLVEGG
jgi:hypothetical protein